MPDKIGRYDVLRELGAGGMAVVYLARDPAMKRQVAVKILPRQFTFDPQFRARFSREAQVIASLEHHAIVPVYDYGDLDEQPFIVMRYMPGGSLADRMKKGPATLAEIAAIFHRLAGALDIAHQQGIIHRDLKPANILFDQQGEAYLSDFGIVKLAESRSALTGSAIIGTPAYMSPEQASGKGAIDGRSDIYSLAVILFELLTHKLPYVADTPMGQAVAHIVEPIPNILEVNPALPPMAEPLMRKALAKKAQDRYPTAGALAEAVSELAGSMKAGIPNWKAGTVTPTPPAPPAARKPTTASLFNTVRTPVAVAFTGVATLGMMGLTALLFAGGVYFAGRFASTATPTASPTLPATAAPTATNRPTQTVMATATEAPTLTDSPTETPTATRRRPPATSTPTLSPTETPTPVCIPPEFFDPFMNRCRIADKTATPQPANSGGGGGGGGNPGGGYTPPPRPTFATQIAAPP